MMESRPRKRFARRWKPIDFPKVERDKLFDELDLTLWAPSVEPDILIIGDTAEFQAHKDALATVSSVFEDMFKGDATIKEIRIRNVSENVLERLYKVIYDSPQKRKEVMQDGIRDDSIVETLELASKYDIVILRQGLKRYFDVYAFHGGSSFDTIIDCCRKLNFDDLADTFTRTQIRFRHEEELKISTFNADIVLQMVKENDFSDEEEFQFFGRASEYVYAKKDKSIKEELKALGTVGRVTKAELQEAYNLQKKKSDTLLDLLEKL